MAQRTIVFNGVDIRTVVAGLKITGITKPVLPTKDRTLVDIPGRSYPYDFGNNFKNSFEVIVDFVIEATFNADNIVGEETMDTKIAALKSWLDVADSRDLVIDSDTYKAQVYSGVNILINSTKNLASGTVIFECYEEVIV